MARNHEISGSAIFSSDQARYLLISTAAGPLAAQEHLSIARAQTQLLAQAQDALRGDTNEGHIYHVETRLALHVIRTHLLGAVLSAFKGVFSMLTGTGQAPLDQLLSGPGREGAAGTVLLPIELLIVVFVLIGAALGVWQGWRSAAWRRNLWIPVTFIAYFLIVSAGAAAYSRLRIPAVPFIAALSGVGWSSSGVRKFLRPGRAEVRGVNAAGR